MYQSQSAFGFGISERQLPTYPLPSQAVRRMSRLHTGRRTSFLGAGHGGQELHRDHDGGRLPWANFFYTRNDLNMLER
jgi:hypothetical protein